MHHAKVDYRGRDRDWNGGNYTRNPARALDFAFGELLLTTPTDYNRRTTREKVLADLEKARGDAKRFDANDKIRQDQAMMLQDIGAPYGGLDKAAARVKAKVFIVVSRYDHVVTPGPATEFAKLIKAALLELLGDCGHLAPSCESQSVNPAISKFLDQR